MILVAQQALISIRELAHSPIKAYCQKWGQSALHAKHQQQSESLKVHDIMDDDSLSFEWVN
jgi:hypothetical protein